jgi:hypothetical protein
VVDTLFLSVASDSNATNMLQAIRYNRGSLQLLDQVLIFPLHFTVNFILFFFVIADNNYFCADKASFRKRLLGNS